MWGLLLLSVAACLFGTGLCQMGWSFGFGGGQNGQVDSCTRRESRTAFSRCMYSFGAAHRLSFPELQASPTCKTEIFDCNEVDTLIQCLNALPTALISNTCWRGMRDLMTSNFQRYDLPCTYQDIEGYCTNSTDLLPVSSRQGTGTDQNIPARRQSNGNGWNMSGRRQSNWFGRNMSGRRQSNWFGWNMSPRRQSNGNGWNMSPRRQRNGNGWNMSARRQSNGTGQNSTARRQSTRTGQNNNFMQGFMNMVMPLFTTMMIGGGSIFGQMLGGVGGALGF